MFNETPYNFTNICQYDALPDDFIYISENARFMAAGTCYVRFLATWRKKQ